jgi:dihydrofolate reductase
MFPGMRDDTIEADDATTAQRAEGPDMTQDTTGGGTKARKVVANITLSLDGRVNGPGGEYDMSWIVPHSVTDEARDGMMRMIGSATTAVLGRKNYEGFGGYWPTVAKDENAEPRDRSFARWLDSVEKVVVSSTLTDAPWDNSRIVRGKPVAEVRQLREQADGDIVVLNSSSVIVALLEAGEVDRLSIHLCPELVGGGDRLFDRGLPASSWSLTDLSTSGSGAIWLIYDRIRVGG